MMLCCNWQQLPGARRGKAPPADLVRHAVAVSGVFDLQPLVGIDWLQPDLRLSPAMARQVSPALYPPPAQRSLVAAVGSLESAEFIRQTRLMQAAWGHDVVPVCEELPGRNHFDVLFDLADTASSLHRHTCALLGLPA